LPVRGQITNEQNSREERTPSRRYIEASSHLERLMIAYAAGDTELDDGNEVSADRISSEIVGKYRGIGCLQNDAGVSYDGPLQADILAALKATAERFNRL
jgi:hypothetical protein